MRRLDSEAPQNGKVALPFYSETLSGNADSTLLNSIRSGKCTWHSDEIQTRVLAELCQEMGKNHRQADRIIYPWIKKHHPNDEATQQELRGAIADVYDKEYPPAESEETPEEGDTDLNGKPAEPPQSAKENTPSDNGIDQPHPRKESSKEETNGTQFGTIDGVDWREVSEHGINLIVPGHLSAGITVIVADEKIGKTTLAMQLAKAVASGTAFFGETAIKGRVCYMALQISAGEVEALRNKQLWSPAEKDECRVHTSFSTLPKQTGGHNLVERFKQYVIADGFRLAVVDMLQSLAEAAGIDDINNYDKMSGLLNDLNQFALKNGVALVILHHLNKSGTYLGSKAIGGSATSIVELRESEEKKVSEVDANIKSRADIQKGNFVFRWGNNNTWEMIGNTDAVESKGKRNLVVQALEKHGKLTRSQIEEITAIPRSTLCRYLSSLKREGIVFDKPNGNAVCYDLVRKVEGVM